MPKTFSPLLLGLIFLATSCTSTPTRQPDPEPIAEFEIYATMTAMASPVISTPIPHPTEMPIDGLFCEYGFCIGHPAEIYLIDASTIRNPATPSTRAYGILIAFSPSIFNQVAWTISGPTFDYGAAQGYVREEKDQLVGNMQVKLVRELNVYYQALHPTSSDKLPYGAIATWQCGDRDFAWKIYTPQENMAPGLLEQALSRFRCK